MCISALPIWLSSHSSKKRKRKEALENEEVMEKVPYHITCQEHCHRHNNMLMNNLFYLGNLKVSICFKLYVYEEISLIF